MTTFFKFGKLKFNKCQRCGNKFTANTSAAHPNGQPGWYSIGTQGSLDTIGYLYDSSGNQLAYNDDSAGNTNFHIYVKLTYCQTYYIRVKAHGSNIGNYSIIPSYYEDNNGDSFATAITANSVYYNDQTINANLYIHQDKDFFKFVPARDCVMEIYTEGSTATSGSLYNSCMNLLRPDSSSTQNGNFKITYHFKAMQFYYIMVAPTTSADCGNYSLRFKFVKDYCNNIIDEQYRVMYWYDDNQSEIPPVYNTLTRSLVFISNRAKAEFEDRVICDEYAQKSDLRKVLDAGNFTEILNYLTSQLIASIPGVGTSMSLAYDVGSIMYNYMEDAELNSYKEKKIEIENTNKYIIGQHYWFSAPNGQFGTGYHRYYTTGSGSYYGETARRGKFIETYIKHTE